MDHPFEVGKEYRNRNGRCEVLSIDAPKMRVRYEDGREETLFITGQVLAWNMWQGMPEPPPPVVQKSAPRKRKKPAKKRPSKSSKQDKLIAEILEDDEAIYEILTRLVIPPGQIALYRHFLKHPDDYFSQQEIADAVRRGDLESEKGVFMAFGRRIGESPDERVQSVKPNNRLFLEDKKSGGKTLLRMRPRVREIFQTYPKFYNFLINDSHSWLPDEFGAADWESSPDVYRRQMAYFGLLDPDRGSGEPAVD